MAMNTNTPAMPTMSAVTPLSMLSRPRLGPTARSSTANSGAASEPDFSSSASSRASPACSPVIWKLLLNTPRMVASLITCSSVTSRLTFLPSTSLVSRRFSISTTAMRLLRFCRVVRSMLSPARASSLMFTAGPSCDWPLVALVSWSPVAITSRLSSTGRPKRVWV